MGPCEHACTLVRQTRCDRQVWCGDALWRSDCLPQEDRAGGGAGRPAGSGSGVPVQSCVAAGAGHRSVRWQDTGPAERPADKVRALQWTLHRCAQQEPEPPRGWVEITPPGLLVGRRR
jgi:hypothetical protein